MSIKNNEQINIEIKKIGTKKLLELPINKFAEKIGVSTSAISRYVRDNGFKDYKSFQLSLVKNNYSAEVGIVKSFDEKDIINLTSKIENISNDIRDASKVIIFGFGQSSFASTELYDNLIQVAKTSILFTDFQKILLSIPTITNKDLVICFSERASSPEVNFIFQRLKHTKCKMWLIGAAKEFDNVKNLVIPVEQSHFFRIGAQESMIKQFGVVNSLVSYYITSNKLHDYKIISQSLLSQWNASKK